MKRSLLISSILLASAGCAADRGELRAVREEALASRASLIDKVFVSTGTYVHRTWDRVTGDDGAIEWVERLVEVKVRLTFVRADHYSLDDDGTGLDYEIVVEKYAESTGETFFDDGFTFFVRKTAEGHQFLTCSSTRRCYTEHDISTMSLEATPASERLVLENRHGALADTKEDTLEFVRIPR